MRCSACRYSVDEALPALNKRVIYLDQSLLSWMLQVEEGGRLPLGHEDFAIEAHRLLKRLVLLQQIVCPHSDIHRDETTVFNRPNELRRAYEFLGGDLTFTESHDVEQAQLFHYATAFVDDVEPSLPLNVDEVLEDQRNEWLADMHIGVEHRFEAFADAVRKVREDTSEGMQRVVARWQEERPTFDVALQREYADFGGTRQRAMTTALRTLMEGGADDDPLAFLNAASHPVLREYRMLCDLFSQRGINEADVPSMVVRFWNWERLREMPHHAIFAHLFAELARRVGHGQRKVSRGFLNDVRAIATYAPYVDAMFVDSECESMLRAPRVVGGVSFQARIFSVSSGREFLEYLNGIDASTPREVREFARRIYGVA